MTITDIVNKFNELNNYDHRYSSFDYCYNYFFKNQKCILQDKEKSCAILGFYLASWGMMRGSSFLLQKSYKYYISLIEYIATLEDKYWNIDVQNYDIEENFITNLYKNIKEIIIEDKNRDIVLITKIMLGVFGITPAFDEYFCKTFKKIEPKKSRFRFFNKESLEVIYNFYQKNKNEIDNLSTQIKTFDFNTKNEKYNYKKAKIIDMYGFQKSVPNKYK